MSLITIVNKILIRFNKEYIIEKSDLFDKNWYSLEYNVRVDDAAKHYLEKGWLSGNDPSEFFSTNDYLECNPDTRVMNSLVHYETYGRQEKRILSIRPKKEKRIDTINYVNGCKFIYESNTTKNRKDVAIFAAYSKKGSIPNYVVYTLKELSKVVDDIIYISDNYIKDSKEIEKIKSYVSYAEFDRHNSYDYGSWKRGIEYLRNKGIYNQINRLYLINDSQYGPINGFEDVFNKMNSKDYDFWGLTDSDDSRYHLVSFFQCFTNKVFTDDIFINHINKIKPNMEYLDIVFNIERKFTAVLRKKYKCGCYSKDFCKNTREVFAGNSFAMLWQTSMLENGFPYIKVKSLDGTWKNEKASYEDTSKALKYIKKLNPELYSLIIEDLQNRGVEIKTLTNDFYNQVDKKDYVSFDVFDTLIIRPFKEPHKLFEYIEKKYKLEGYGKERMIAQNRAYIDAEGEHEITIDEIYNHIVPKFKNIKDVEIEEEKRLCKANPLIIDVYKYCLEKNKKLIAISDMYLSEDIISDILKKNNFLGFSKIYVSSGRKETKANKGLFELVIKENRIDRRKMVHIGDNVFSDIENAKSLGIDAYTQDNPIAHMYKSAGTYKFQHFNLNDNGLAASIYMQKIAEHFCNFENDNSYFYELGYQMCGPLALSFLSFICEKAKENKVDKLFFVARDGYLLKELYKKYFYKKSKIDYDYVYLTRAVVLSATLEYKDNINYLKSILYIYKKDGNKINVSDSYENNLRTFKSNYSKIKKWSQENYNNLKRDLERKAKGYKNIAIVDMTTGDFTSLSGAIKVLKNKISLGIFSCILKSNGKYPCEFMGEYYNGAVGNRELTFSELLISSPEESIIKIDKKGNPIYNSTDIENRKNRYSEIYRGADDYIKEMLSTFGYDKNVLFTMDEWVYLSKCFLDYKTITDEKYLKDITIRFNPIMTSKEDIHFIDK